MKDSAGIAATSVYRPSRYLSADDLAAQTGIPAGVIVEKFGLRGKPVAAPDEHVSDLAIKAARPLLAATDSARIGAVIYFGSPWKDFPVWQAAPRIQHELGLSGYAIEAVNVSCGLPVALKLARGMLAEDPDLQEVLLAGGCRESTILDYSNPRSRFMFNFADAGAALLLRRGGPNPVLATALHTDGSFWADVLMPAGGSAEPASHATVDQRRHYLDVPDPRGMKERLDPLTLPNFTRVAREAVAKSGSALSDVDLLLPLHTKRSLFAQILAALGLRADQAVYLDDWGHMSALDPAVGLHLAQAEGRLRPGDLVLMLSAGTGYTWGATCIRWG